MRSNALAGRFLAFTVLLSLATLVAAQTSQTTTEVQKGETTVTTSLISGVVEYVEGNSLVVKMPNGKLRTYNVPESRRFIVDGKELTVHELVPGTKLTATVKTTTTPITVRTTTIKSGTVWHVMGNNVILTLPNGENKQFTVKDDTRFTVNGNPATVRDLKKGTVVYAERVVEEPMTEFATDTTVVGEAPAPSAAPATAVAQQAPAEPPPAVAQDTPAAPAPAVAQDTPAAPAVAQEQAAAPPPAPVEQAPAPAKTSSRLPVIVGLLLVAGVLVIWVLSRRKS
jgi:hypothetical protein